MARQPNLLFIMTDQQRFDTLGANGNERIHTPNLDALAASGVNVQGYHTACPVCVPSRCTLFTGRYPHSHRVRENHNVLEGGREIHLFRALHHAGYRLGYAGKNHLLEAPEFANFELTDVWGHDHEPTGAEQELDEYCRENRRRLGAHNWRAAHYHDFPDEATRTWNTAEAGLRFLGRLSGGDAPFCLCVSFADPHSPYVAPRRFQELYPPEQMQLYPRREGELQEKARRYDMKWRAQGSPDAPEDEMREFMSAYYGMVTYVDEQVGRLLDALREAGLAEDTVVVFTSDHGEFCFEHGMYRKDLVLLDSLLRVPMLLRAPGLEPRVLDESTLMGQVDVMPTLLDLLDLPVPVGVQGRSLVPLLRGEADGHREAVYAEICPPYLYNRFQSWEEFLEHHGPDHPFTVPGDFTKSVRTPTHRYVWYGTGEEELYDLRTDPHEQHNLAGDPEHADTLTALKLRLLEWHALTEDPLDPFSISELQEEYSGWQGAQSLRRNQWPPDWVDQRYQPGPRNL